MIVWDFFLQNWYWIIGVCVLIWAIFKWELIQEMAKSILMDPVRGFFSSLLHVPVRAFVVWIVLGGTVLSIVLLFLGANWILSQAAGPGITKLQGITPFFNAISTPHP